MTSLRQAFMLDQGGVISLVGSGGKTSLMFKLARELSKAGDSVLTTTTTKIFEPEPDQTSGLIVSDTVASLLNQAAELIDKHRHLTMAHDRLPAQGKLIGFAPKIVNDLWNSHLFRWIIVEADGAAGRPLKAPANHEPVVPDCTSCIVGLVGLNGVGRPLDDQWVFRPERFAQLAGISQGFDITEASVVNVLTHNQGIFKNVSTRVLRIVFLNQADTPKNFAAGQGIVRLLTEKKNVGLDRVVIGQTRTDPPVLEVFELTSDNT